ncbi:MAG: hypothetical protein LC104_05260 [Bacteroidales bacterium]|nr:hypothetical protein [Bacteroidales bacterium]
MAFLVKPQHGEFPVHRLPDPSGRSVPACRSTPASQAVAPKNAEGATILSEHNGTTACSSGSGNGEERKIHAKHFSIRDLQARNLSSTKFPNRQASGRPRIGSCPVSREPSDLFPSPQFFQGCEFMGDFIGGTTFFVIMGLGLVGMIGLLIFLQKKKDDDDE